MSAVKEVAIKLIESLPENCSWEDIQYRIYFCGEVEQGLQDSKEGKVVSNEEAQRRMLEWARSVFEETF